MNPDAAPGTCHEYASPRPDASLPDGMEGRCHGAGGRRIVHVSLGRQRDQEVRRNGDGLRISAGPGFAQDLKVPLAKVLLPREAEATLPARRKGVNGIRPSIDIAEDLMAEDERRSEVPEATPDDNPVPAADAGRPNPQDDLTRGGLDVSSLDTPSVGPKVGQDCRLEPHGRTPPPAHGEFTGFRTPVIL